MYGSCSEVWCCEVKCGEVVVEVSVVLYSVVGHYSIKDADAWIDTDRAHLMMPWALYRVYTV